MRFIGSKIQLLEEIDNFIQDNIPFSEGMIFCDLFSGSGAVARYFKEKYEIISNDMMHFSYVLQSATIELKKVPNFTKLKKYLFLDSLESIFKYFEENDISLLIEKFKIKEEELFIYSNYTPNSPENRMYLIKENGRRIDIIRIALNKLLKEKIISKSEFIYLLSFLIEEVHYVTNINGV